MRHFAFISVAACSLLLSCVAQAVTRPHYGGTLRVALQEAPESVDPSVAVQANAPSLRNLLSLVFDTLVRLDQHGNPQPALAVAWQAEPGDQRWQFQLRQGVTWQDGSLLTADQVAASLRVANPQWKILAVNQSIIIQRDSPTASLLAELALSRNAIVKHNGPQVSGTGPFSIAAWNPGKKLSLTVYSNYWDGRAFLNNIEIELGKSYREQILAFDLGKFDLIEIPPDQIHRAMADGRHVETSYPAELVVLAFARGVQSGEEGQLRKALAANLDRAGISNVLLQRGAEPAGGILPNWMTGYSFLFPVTADEDRARQIRGDLRLASPWTLAYDANDPITRLVAERVILNARDVNIAMRITSSSAADVRILRTPLVSLNARAALTEITAACQMAAPSFTTNNQQDVFAAENAVLQLQRVIPLVHLRAGYGISAVVKNWSETANGDWQLSNVWLEDRNP